MTSYDEKQTTSKNFTLPTNKQQNKRAMPTKNSHTPQPPAAIHRKTRSHWDRGSMRNFKVNNGSTVLHYCAFFASSQSRETGQTVKRKKSCDSYLCSMYRLSCTFSYACTAVLVKLFTNQQRTFYKVPIHVITLSIPVHTGY